MERLSISDQVDLMRLVVDNFTAQFELWVTITFAVIVASYLAGQRLRSLLKWLVATLYLLVSVLLFLVGASGVQMAAAIGGTEVGFGSPLVWAIGTLRTIVWVLGTIVTLVFVFFGYRDTTPGR